MKTILLTGGLGFVGGRLARKLSENFDVYVSSRSIPDKKVLELHGNVKALKHDLLLSAKSFPKELNTVIHLAALNEWDCIKYPSEAIRVNIDETRIILENAISSGVKYFIYFSTAHIYGNPLQGIINEETLPAPVHPYAITHKAAEDYVLAAGKQNKINSIIIRLSNSFGAPISASVNRWTLLANDLCRQAVEKGSLTLLSNGCQYRDFVCLTDVENTINQIVTTPSAFKKNIYNLGAGKSLRVKDLTQTIASVYHNLFNKEISIYYPEGAEESIEPPLVFSVERLISEGVLIKNDIEAELKEFLTFCYQNFLNTD